MEEPLEGKEGASLHPDFDTNLDVIRLTVARAVSEVIDSLIADGSPSLFDPGQSLTPYSTENLKRTVLLASRSQHEGNWIIENALLEELIKRGFRVVIDDQENSAQRDSLTPPPDNTIFVSPGSPMRLSYRVEEIRTDYLGQNRKGLIGEKMAKRLVRVRFSLQATDPVNGQVLWQGPGGFESFDSFPVKHLSKVEVEDYNFAKSQLSGKNLGKILEPIIASGVVGGLIYLFFSNR